MKDGLSAEMQSLETRSTGRSVHDFRHWPLVEVEGDVGGSLQRGKETC